MNKKGFIWNLIGSSIYAVASMVLGSACMRILGADSAGIFIFAFSTIGQHIYIISYFGMRPIHITDVGNNFSFGDYRAFRIKTCIAAVLSSAVFALLYAPDNTEKLCVIIIMGVYKAIDGLCDCYESELQRDGRLDCTGKALAFRNLMVMFVFILVMKISGSLIMTCVAATFAHAVAWVLFCVLPLMNKTNCSFEVSRGSTKKLFDAGKWLFLSSFLDLYVFSASKYAIDATKDSTISGYYGILFIPASAVNVTANFVIRPVLTSLSEDYENGFTASFRKKVKKISCVIAGLTFLGMIVAFFAGIPVLTLFVGAEEGAALEAYRVAFTILVAGGGFYALLNLYYYALVILKAQKNVFKIYLVGTVVATVLCFPAAYFFGINGAAVSYFLVMGITTVLFGLDYGKKIR